MAAYISCHTIACMTLQQVRYLEKALRDESELQLLRVAGSQLSGKLLLELSAENRETLERIFQSHNIHFDWLIRLDFDHR